MTLFPNKLNDNYKNTFRVDDGSIKVTYEDYDFFNDTATTEIYTE